MGDPEHIGKSVLTIMMRLMKPSVVCRIWHVQNCHWCDDLTCGDNTSDLKSRLDKAEANERRLEGNMREIRKSLCGQEGARKAAELEVKRLKKELKELKKGATE